MARLGRNQEGISQTVLSAGGYLQSAALLDAITSTRA